MRPVECCSFFSFLFFNSQSFPPFLFPRKKAFLLPSTPDGVDVFFYDFFMEHDGAKDSYIPSIEKKKRKGKGGYFWGPRFGLNFLADGQRSPKLGSGILKINRNDKLKITPFSTIRIDRIPPPPTPTRRPRAVINGGCPGVGANKGCTCRPEIDR